MAGGTATSSARSKCFTVAVGSASLSMPKRPGESDGACCWERGAEAGQAADAEGVARSSKV